MVDGGVGIIGLSLISTVFLGGLCPMYPTPCPSRCTRSKKPPQKKHKTQNTKHQKALKKQDYHAHRCANCGVTAWAHFAVLWPRFRVKAAVGSPAKVPNLATMLREDKTTYGTLIQSVSNHKGKKGGNPADLLRGGRGGPAPLPCYHGPRHARAVASL